MKRWLIAGLAVLGIALLVQLMIAAWWRADRSRYGPATATIVSVSRICSLEQIHYGSRSPSTRLSGDMDCAEARRRAAAGDGELVTAHSLGWRYVSPVDGRRYRGSGRSTDPALADLRPGDRIDILAGLSEPEASRLP